MIVPRESLVRMAGFVNAGVIALIRSPRWGRLVGRGLAMMTYTGRRSGKVFTTPVGYRRTGDDVQISVAMPESKTWWRNFLEAGGPLSLRLDGVDRPGHAVARRDPKGRVIVSVLLEPR